MNLKMNDEIMEHHTPFFDKSTTLVIKGIALIMMFIHHFFTFPSVWIDGTSYPLLEKLAPFLCSPTKLCVSIFCFLSGYCYYFSKEKSIRHSLIKISDLFIAYWLVFIIFALLAKFCVGYVYSIEGILLEAFALSLPTMRYCWYVYFYVLFMLALPLITKIMRGGSSRPDNHCSSHFYLRYAFEFHCAQYNSVSFGGKYVSLVSCCANGICICGVSTI